MEKEDCKYFDSCEAPLCPYDGDSLQFGAWFPGESICRLKVSPDWVKRQRKIEKKLDFDSGCFTVRMLKQKCKVTGALKGINPDKGPARDQEGKWIAEHPEYIPSEKQIEAFKKSPVSQGITA